MDSLTVTAKAGVTILTMNRPPMNTLDIPFMEKLTAAVQDLSKKPQGERPRAILLRSELEDQFCLGIDPKAVLETDVDGRVKIFLALGDLVEALWFCHIPIVADINGPAMAGGAVLAALADFAVIQRQEGKISFSEAKVGLPLPPFVQALIKSRANPSTWAEIMLLGKNLDAEAAMEAGLANGIYEIDVQRDELLQSYLSKITRLPPKVLQQNLKEMKEPFRELLRSFKMNVNEFSLFLTDEYLGKGLGAVVRGESPVF